VRSQEKNTAGRKKKQDSKGLRIFKEKLGDFERIP
jgi:hypothetical protein